MQKQTIAPFKVIGISVRTTNENGQAMTDISELWDRFMAENLMNSISCKKDHTVYSLYTDYEGDYTKPYTTIIGCKVEHLDEIPEGMVGRAFEGGNYVKITAKGDLSQGLIGNEWAKIWQMDLDRSYIVDFEVFGEKAQNPVEAEIDFFIGIK